MTPTTTVAQAVIQAGGAAPDARLDRVRLLRDGETHYIDLTRPHRELDDVRVQSGDQILMDQRRSVWRQSVQPAIATAGSLASFSILILRLTRGS
jgi:protein involved in polysaccharide export with SLBB domain